MKARILFAIMSALLALSLFPRVLAREPKKKVKIVYPKKTALSFEGFDLEGELRNPGEFYFQHRDSGDFDSLSKRRPNFHREMLRDAVMTK